MVSILSRLQQSHCSSGNCTLVPHVDTRLPLLCSVWTIFEFSPHPVLNPSKIFPRKNRLQFYFHVSYSVSIKTGSPPRIPRGSPLHHLCPLSISPSYFFAVIRSTSLIFSPTVDTLIHISLFFPCIVGKASQIFLSKGTSCANRESNSSLKFPISSPSQSDTYSFLIISSPITTSISLPNISI